MPSQLPYTARTQGYHNQQGITSYRKNCSTIIIINELLLIFLVKHSPYQSQMEANSQGDLYHTNYTHYCNTLTPSLA